MKMLHRWRGIFSRLGTIVGACVGLIPDSLIPFLVCISFQVKGMSILKQSQSVPTKNIVQPNPLSRAMFAIFGGNKQGTSSAFNDEGAKKVDPKLFFANERTFLKWMNVSIWVAGISIGLSSIVGPSAGGESLSTLLFLAIAIVIVVYSMVQCKYQVQYCVRR
jgi:hypothetical protein